MSDKTKPTVLLEHYLKRLKLPTMLPADGLDQISSQVPPNPSPTQ